MTAYFKATRPEGTDFQTGAIDYAAALASGEVIRHAAKRIRNRPETYLSVSISAADCTGFSWPCRLFRVEPVGRVMSKLDAGPNKRAVSALRVVEELPAWQALGPNGEAVAGFIEQARRLTPDQVGRLAAAWYAARDAARAAAWYAARDAARAAAWGAAWYAAWDAVGDAAGAAAWAAARDATLALMVRDLISPEHFDLLTKPWRDAGLPL
jgi:hypothetical protein